MGILLYHDHHTDGQVALAEGNVAGSPTPARRYHQQGHFLLVEGQAHVMEHDIAELHRLGYRVASAAEQGEFFGAKRKAQEIQEVKEPAIKEPAIKATTASKVRGK